MNKTLLLGILSLTLIALVITLYTKKQGETPIAEAPPQTQKYTGGIYTTYAPEKISQTGDTVLFFHATRCPTCESARKSFAKSGIPKGLTLLQVDYDTADELKKKYNILTQTSYVYIDKKGKQIKRRVGGRDIESILAKIQEAKTGTLKPWEKIKATTKAQKKDNQPNFMTETSKTAPKKLTTAYFAGGCFWCIEGPLESLEGVDEVISGYIGGKQENATYEKVSTGKTKHRESVKVIYDENKISYGEILDTFWRQIDPTDTKGQFADKGYQYTTAIFYNNEKQKFEAERQKKALQDSEKFDKPIAVQILPFTSFYPAEEYHQNYYKTNTKKYERYAKGSGRKGFIQKERKEASTSLGNSSVTPKIVKTKKTNAPDTKKEKMKNLTELQRRVLFEKGTEQPFKNKYRDNHDDGIYVDVIDGTPLFSSLDKFDSGTGWPSFSKPIYENTVADETDNRYGMKRTEVTSASSSGHLGHIFDDGPPELGGQRYCINSASLEFIPLAEMKEKGYGEYVKLFEK